MNNFLEGMQYRDLKAEFPTYGVDPYGPWQDCPDAPASVTFAKGTQFRIKPKYTYSATVTGFGPKETLSGNKDKVMSFVAGALEEGKEVNVSRTNTTSGSVNQILQNQNVQFKIGDSEWRSTVYFSDAGHAGRVKFRLRPDTFFKVRVSSGVTCAELTFDDVETMLQYVNSKSRTTDFNITITRERYAR